MRLQIGSVVVVPGQTDEASPDYEARVVSIRGAHAFLSNMNMPFCGGVADWFLITDIRAWNKKVKKGG